MCSREFNLHLWLCNISLIVVANCSVIGNFHLFVAFSLIYSFLVSISVYCYQSKILLIENMIKWYGNSLSYKSIELQYYRYQIKYLGPESIIKDNNLAELNAGNCPPHMSVSSNNQCTTSTTKIFNHQNHWSHAYFPV